jgi:hypothetical protein
MISVVDIELDEFYVQSLLLERLEGRFAPRNITGSRDDFNALLGELSGGFQADTFVGAGN